MGFSDFLRRGMGRLGIGPTELGRRVGVSHPSVIKWMNGSVPRPNKIEPIARALGVSTEDVYEALGWIGEIGDLSTEERRMVKLLRRLSPRDAERLEQIGRLLLGEEEHGRRGSSGGACKETGGSTG